MNESHRESPGPPSIGDSTKEQYERSTRTYEEAKQLLAGAEKGRVVLVKKIEAFRASIHDLKGVHYDDISPEQRKAFHKEIAEKEEFLGALESMLNERDELIAGFKSVIAEMDQSLLN